MCLLRFHILLALALVLIKTYFNNLVFFWTGIYLGCSQAKKMTGVQKHKLQKRGVTKHKSFLENINLCGFTTFF